jgi:hypothetical protein
VSRLEEQVTAARADLGDRTSQDRDQITQLAQQLDDLHVRITGVSDQVDERVTAALSGSQEQLGSAVARLEEQVTAARADRSSSETPDGEQSARLEKHLGDLKELLVGVAVRIDTGLEELREPQPADAGSEQGFAELRAHVDARLEEVLARLDTAGTAREDDGASQLAEIAGTQEHLTSAMTRLEEQVAAALAKPGGGKAPSKKQSDTMQRQLSDLSEQLAAVGARIENEVEPALASLQDQEQDTGKFTAVIEQVDKRVADALAGLEGQSTQVDGNAAAQLSELATSHEQLNTAVGRMEEQLSGALAGLGSQAPPVDGEQAAGVERQLAIVGEQLKALGARIENEVEPVLATLQQREQDDGVEKSLADLRTQLAGITEQVDKRVADALSEVDSRGQGGAGDAAAGKATGGARKKSTPAAVSKAAPPERKGPKQVVAALIDALNSGDPKVIRKFVADEYSESALSERPVKDRVEVYMSFREEAGEVVLCHVDGTDGEEIMAVVQETDSPQRHRFMLALDPTPPHKIYVVNIDVL